MDVWTEVPAVPVLLPLTVLLLLGTWLIQRRRETFNWNQLITVWAASLYLVAVLAVTLLPLQIALGTYANRTPWQHKMIFVPLITIDSADFMLNVVMTLPLGFLLPLLFRMRGVTHVGWIGLAVSAIIELIQFITDVFLSSGRTCDVNDLIANTLGAVLGYLVWRRIAPFTRRFQLVGHPA